MMDISSYIKDMPKAEINLSLEGAVQPSVWLLIAEQNEIMSESRKTYQATVDLLQRKDFYRSKDLVKNLCSWLRYPDDLVRLVYDAGLALAKQNVKYAEITINPSLFMLNGMSFDMFMSTLNDGRDRVERGWGTILRWNFAVDREEPRRADDIVRSASSLSGKKQGIVGYGLIGVENAQPIGQFERAFQAAHKKDIPTFVRAGEALGNQGLSDALEILHPSRLVDGHQVLESDEIINKLIEDDIPLVITPTRAKRLKHITDAYPIRDMLNKKLSIVVSADAPVLSDVNLTQVYQELAVAGDLTVTEINELALNALHYSFLDEDLKTELIAQFKSSYQELEQNLAG
jgi:adenosine deaminase